MQSAPPLASNDQRRAAKFDDDAKVEDGRASRDNGSGAGAGGREGGGMVYDLLAVVVHRGSAYSGHYHALIRDCLQEVRSEGEARGGGGGILPLPSESV